MNRVIRDPNQADAAWLTAVLTEAAALEAGAVASVAMRAGGSRWARHAHLALTYTPASRGPRPARLFLKICESPEVAAEAAELRYYTRDFRGVTDAPMPRCYHAARSRDPPAYHLLLEDLSATHRELFPEPPDGAACEAVAVALARLHAPHWGADAAARAGAAPPDAAGWGCFFAATSPGAARLAAAMAPADRETSGPALAALVEAGAAELSQLDLVASGVTYLHGDLNPGNIMVPRRAPGRAMLLDRQPFAWSLRGGPGAFDLANWLALHSDPAVRRHHGPAARAAYQTELARLGRDYPTDSLERDFRAGVSVAAHLVAAWGATGEDPGATRAIWTMLARRVVHAAGDLGLIPADHGAPVPPAAPAEP